MATIATKLQQVRLRIAAACVAARRPVQSVTLLAVSKTFGPAAVREAHAAGQLAFGENYVQEALAKIDALADLRPSIEWHLIGPLQSNKTREVAAVFDWVHSVDRLKTAERLSAQRPRDLPPLQAVSAGQHQRRDQQERGRACRGARAGARGRCAAERDAARTDGHPRADGRLRGTARTAPGAARTARVPAIGGPGARHAVDRHERRSRGCDRRRRDDRARGYGDLR